jgi:hypothetical protein
MLRVNFLAALALALLGAPIASGVAQATAPKPPRLDVTRLAETAARCPPGYRRHTITAKCVQKQPRFPLLGWF